MMPKLHLAHLTEDVEYRKPEESNRVKRQSFGSAVLEEAESEDAEHFAPTAVGTGASPKQDKRRDGIDSAALAAILRAAGNPPPQEIIEGTSYASGRKKRSEHPEPEHSNAHQYGLKEPHVDTVAVRSYGKNGRVVQTPVVVKRKDGQQDFLNGAKERRKRSDNFIPFSEYEAERVKVVKDEEIGFLALQRKIQIEKKQLARKSKALDLENVKVQLTAAK